MRRRCRELDVALGWVEKISMPKAMRFLRDLDTEIRAVSKAPSSAETATLFRISTPETGCDEFQIQSDGGRDLLDTGETYGEIVPVQNFVQRPADVPAEIVPVEKFVQRPADVPAVCFAWSCRRGRGRSRCSARGALACVVRSLSSSSW